MNSKNFFSQIVSLLLNRQQKSSFFAIFSAVFIFLLCCCFVLRSPTPEKIEKLSAEQNFTDEINAKVAWLDNSYLSLIPGSSKIYQSIADKFLSPEQPNTKSTSNIIKFLDLGDLVDSIKNNTAQLILKFIFISIAFAPFWIASGILGILYWKKVFPVKAANHLLKLFSKENSPYYTGIYAKLKVDEDRNVSCFCPGLTAPRLEKIELALTQPLTQQLREFEAFNDTNLSLVQIILAYPDYPGDIYQDDFSDNRLTLINSANQGLNSILSLHKILGQYIGALKNQDYPLDRLNFEYTLHYLALDKLGEKLDNVARVALQCLTPNLAWALSEMSSQAVATAYLATEAGKCLVFKKEGEHFLRISQHPHLQARAILQSVESYFNDYSYNEREQIRQAVIYSTSVNPEKEILLPLQMTKGAKGLRNCLEILWHLNNNWQSKAKTLELHGHLSDLHHNFCENYLNKISTQHIVGNPHIYGLPYRSLTLVAIDLITECSFINIDEERINRIIQLLNEDEEFKNFEKFLVSSKGKNRLEIQKQIITFAMLKKHNWAANKIGDFYLPQERVIKSIVVGQDTSTSRSLVFGFESLVPLRQSKFQEYFGIDWKEKYFPQAPHHHSVKIFVDQESYQNNLNLEVDLLKAHGKGSAISALRRF